MVWEIKFTEFADKQLGKLNKTIAKQITNYLIKISKLDNPKQFGKSLRLNKFGLWRYRVNDHRILCEIKDHELIILVVKLGHRKDIYED